MVLKGNVSYNDVLPLINSIIQRNKYANITRNETNSTFIWHSEKGANTCVDCKSLDNATFCSGDIMLVPPLHPNCKCELEEIKQTDNNNKQSEYKECDCQDVIRNIYQELENILKEANSILIKLWIMPKFQKIQEGLNITIFQINPVTYLKQMKYKIS